MRWVTRMATCVFVCGCLMPGVVSAADADGAAADFMVGQTCADEQEDDWLPADPAEIYALAEAREAEEDYLAAHTFFSMIPDYGDALARAANAKVLMQAANFRLAEEAEAAGDTMRAMFLFADLGEYRGSLARARALGWDDERDGPGGGETLGTGFD